MPAKKLLGYSRHPLGGIGCRIECGSCVTANWGLPTFEFFNTIARRTSDSDRQTLEKSALARRKQWFH
jgi:hypothetical protein